METNTIVRAVEASLDHADPEERAHALRRVRDSSARRLATRVEALLQDRHAEVRYEAAHTLGHLGRGSERAPRALLECVDDRLPLVRVAAIEALGTIGARRGAAKIRRCLLDPDPLVRAYAGASIGALRPRCARSVLSKAVAKDRSPRARVGLYEGLFSSGERGALVPLLALLRSRQYRVRSAVANTVASLSLDREVATMALSALQSALASEATVAARSSLEAVIDTLKAQVLKNAADGRRSRHMFRIVATARLPGLYAASHESVQYRWLRAPIWAGRSAALVFFLPFSSAPRLYDRPTDRRPCEQSVNNLTPNVR